MSIKPEITGGTYKTKGDCTYKVAVVYPNEIVITPSSSGIGHGRKFSYSQLDCLRPCSESGCGFIEETRTGRLQVNSGKLSKVDDKHRLPAILENPSLTGSGIGYGVPHVDTTHLDYYGRIPKKPEPKII